MGAVRVTLVCVVLGGCAGDVCIDGVCANPDERRPLPGPCSAHRRYLIEDHTNTTDAVFTYDRGLLVHIDSTFDGWGGAMLNTPLHTVTTVDWSYNSAREIARISSPTFQWILDAQAVTRTQGTDVCVYDRATFAFLPFVDLADQLSPRAELGLMSCGASKYSWTQTGQTLTRTTDNRVDTFVLDGRSNITSADFVLTTDGVPGEATESWRFDDGERLAEHLEDNGELSAPVDHTVYRYDQGGNLIEEIDKVFGRNTIYSYDCW